jgi:hypothetical protein
MKTMNDFKGTQGEFKIDEYFINQDECIEIYGTGSKIIARFLNHNFNSNITPEESEANAKLFAASRKLLEACILSHAELKYALNTMAQICGGIDQSNHSVLIKLEQAINEAL